MKRTLKAVACALVGSLIGFGSLIYTNTRFQIILLHQHHRTADLGFLGRIIFFYARVTFGFVWPTALVFFAAYAFLRQSAFIPRWLIGVIVGALSGTVVAYVRISGLHYPNPLEQRYLSGFMPRAVISGASMFLVGWLLARWELRRVHLTRLSNKSD